MKKQLFLSLALLTIGSVLHADKGAAFGGGLITGFGLSTIANAANQPRNSEVVYVKDKSPQDSTIKELREEIRELKAEIKDLKKENRRKRGN